MDPVNTLKLLQESDILDSINLDLKKANPDTWEDFIKSFPLEWVNSFPRSGIFESINFLEFLYMVVMSIYNNNLEPYNEDDEEILERFFEDFGEEQGKYSENLIDFLVSLVDKISECLRDIATKYWIFDISRLTPLALLLSMAIDEIQKTSAKSPSSETTSVNQASSLSLKLPF